MAYIATTIAEAIPKPIPSIKALMFSFGVFFAPWES